MAAANIGLAAGGGVCGKTPVGEAPGLPKGVNVIGVEVDGAGGVASA